MKGQFIVFFLGANSSIPVLKSNDFSKFKNNGFKDYALNFNFSTPFFI